MILSLRGRCFFNRGAGRRREPTQELLSLSLYLEDNDDKSGESLGLALVCLSETHYQLLVGLYFLGLATSSALGEELDG